jgi:hypothetical protein
MPVDYPQIWPYLIAAGVMLLVYRRLRRSFGRQPLRPVPMAIRVALLCVLAISLLPLAVKSILSLATEAAGLTAGIALGVWGARRTRYQSVGGQLYYLPHTYTGIVVSLIFIGRLVYRLAQTRGSAVMIGSPATIGPLFLVIGYYLCYYGWLLWKRNRIGPEDLEAVSASPAASP